MLAARVREHFLDRWYRFAPYGVTCRQDLAPITVEAKVCSTERDGLTLPGREIHVELRGDAAPGLIAVRRRRRHEPRPSGRARR